MEIRQLEAFSAIVIGGNITAAGRMLGRSQPVISRQVSDLESELGFILFERTRPNITLTKQGAEFYQEVRGILADLQQLGSRIVEIRSGKIKPLRILAASDLARGLLPEAIALIDHQAQIFKRKLIIEEIVHEATFDNFLDGSFEFALINLPINAEEMRVHWCGHAPCMLAIPESHPLAIRKTIRMDELYDCDIITLLSSYRMRFSLVNSLIHATAGSSRRHIEVASQQSALSMVAAGLGVALVDPFTLRGNKTNGVCLRPLDTDIDYIIGAVSQSAHKVSESASRLIKGVHNHIKNVIPHYSESDPNRLLTGAGVDSLTNLLQT